MAGTKRERAPGVWELRVHLGRGTDGKRHDVSRTFRGSDRAAGRELAKLVAQADELRAERFAPPAPPGEMTVGDLAARWLRLRASEWAPKTAQDNAGTVSRYIDPHMGAVSVVALRRAQISDFYAELRARGGEGGAPLSAGTVAKVHSVFHAMLEDAVELELLAGNPATKARRPRGDRPERSVPTLAQIAYAQQVALAPSGGRRSRPDLMLATIIRVAIATGARRGEIAALQWGDIGEVEALELTTLAIRRAAYKLPGEPVGVKGTKTGATAVLAIDPSTAAALDEWRRVQQVTALELGRGRLSATDWIFPARRDWDRPVSPDTITGRWRLVAERAGLTGVRFHDLRHATATHMIAAGIDPKTVAGRLRHSTTAMTLDVYTAWLISADRDAALLWGRLLDEVS
jgi:integrase